MVPSSEETFGVLRPILVVDDQESIRAVIRLALELEGYSVFEAANGNEALATLESMPTPGLLLVDLMMPVMNGWELIEELRENRHWKNIPLIVLSAFDGVKRTISGPHEALAKPIDLAVLLQTVKKYSALLSNSLEAQKFSNPMRRAG